LREERRDDLKEAAVALVRTFVLRIAYQQGAWCFFAGFYDCKKHDAPLLGLYKN